MEVLKEAKKDNLKLEISVSKFPEDPRLWDNGSTMLCGHKKYELGDVQVSGEAGSWRAELVEHLREELEMYEASEDEILDEVYFAPLHLYNHGQLRIKIGGFDGHLPQGHARFDSGKVGYIYVPKDEVDSKERADEIMETEVDIYDDYLRGAVYQFVLKEIKLCDECGTTHEEIIDSCGGFYGDDLENNGMKHYIDDDLFEELENVA